MGIVGLIRTPTIEDWATSARHGEGDNTMETGTAGAGGTVGRAPPQGHRRVRRRAQSVGHAGDAAGSSSKAGHGLHLADCWSLLGCASGYGCADRASAATSDAERAGPPPVQSRGSGREARPLITSRMS